MSSSELVAGDDRLTLLLLLLFDVEVGNRSSFLDPNSVLAFCRPYPPRPDSVPVLRPLRPRPRPPRMTAYCSIVPRTSLVYAGFEVKRTRPCFVITLIKAVPCTPSNNNEASRMLLTCEIVEKEEDLGELMLVVFAHKERLLDEALVAG